MCSNSERTQKSCNEFQGFVLVCSLLLRQLSLPEISFSLSETLLTLSGGRGKLAASFCRMNDVVPFTCQFWNRKVFVFFSFETFHLREWFCRACMDFSSTGPRGIRFETHLSLNAVWHHYLATDSRKKAESSAMKNKDSVCLQVAVAANYRFHSVCF